MVIVRREPGRAAAGADTACDARSIRNCSAGRLPGAVESTIACFLRRCEDYRLLLGLEDWLDRRLEWYLHREADEISISSEHGQLTGRIVDVGLS